MYSMDTLIEKFTSDTATGKESVPLTKSATFYRRWGRLKMPRVPRCRNFCYTLKKLATIMILKIFPVFL